MTLNFPHPKHLQLFQLACDLGTMDDIHGHDLWKEFQKSMENGAHMDMTFSLSFPLLHGGIVTVPISAFEVAMTTWSPQWRSQLLDAYGPFDEMTFPNMNCVLQTMLADGGKPLARNFNSTRKVLHTKLYAWALTYRGSSIEWDRECVVDVRLWDLIVRQSQYHNVETKLSGMDISTHLVPMCRAHASNLPPCTDQLLSVLIATHMVSRMDDMDTTGPHMILLMAAGIGEEDLTGNFAQHLFRLMPPEAKALADHLRLAIHIDPQQGLAPNASKM